MVSCLSATRSCHRYIYSGRYTKNYENRLLICLARQTRGIRKNRAHIQAIGINKINIHGTHIYYNPIEHRIYRIFENRTQSTAPKALTSAIKPTFSENYFSKRRIHLNIFYVYIWQFTQFSFVCFFLYLPFCSSRLNTLCAIYVCVCNGKR